MQCAVMIALTRKDLLYHTPTDLLQLIMTSSSIGFKTQPLQIQPHPPADLLGLSSTSRFANTRTTRLNSKAPYWNWNITMQALTFFLFSGTLCTKVPKLGYVSSLSFSHCNRIRYPCVLNINRSTYFINMLVVHCADKCIMRLLHFWEQLSQVNRNCLNK